MDDMTVSEIIKNLSPAARTTLAAIPGTPVQIGYPIYRIQGWQATADELAEARVVGASGGLTIKGAAVVDRIKAQSEPF